MVQINILNSAVSDLISPVKIDYSTFRANSLTAQPKTIEFFELLYGYPNNIKVNWKGINNFKRGSQAKYPVPFADHLNEKDFVGPSKLGYENKITTSDFYNKKTTVIQNALQNVPVYTVLNGRGEIVVANSFIKTKINGIKVCAKEKLHDFCGDFDEGSQKDYRLGFFFMSRQEAEIYLKEIAKADTKGLKTLGLSVNCLGLDAAYRITREHHPRIDFRFVPELNELKSLLTEQIRKSNLNVDKRQLQGQSRPKWANLGVEKTIAFGNWLSPFCNVLEYSEYYKGVPIYIAQFKTKAIKNEENYVFFDKKQASSFYKTSDSKLIRPSRIFCYNLEDFIEKWENSLKEQYYPPRNTLEHSTNSIFNYKNVEFIANKESNYDVDQNFRNLESSPLNFKMKSLKQFFSVKSRTFLSFFDILMNYN